MPDKMKKIRTDALPGKRLVPPPEWFDHNIDVVQEYRQRPEPSKTVKRQNAFFVFWHCCPFPYARQYKRPVYPQGIPHEVTTVRAP